ncbi:MAG: hypothetical protein M1819_004361 [Sarea resinae]|nr:MAG: hypothetical protein M1819_004361 [Sarea resinae]
MPGFVLSDGHNDLAIVVRYLYGNRIYSKNFTDPFEKGGLGFHVDLPRLREGKAGGAFWSAFVECPKNWTDFSDENYAEAVRATISQLDLLQRLQAAYPDYFSQPGNSTTALTAFRKHQLISPLAIEGLHQIGNSFSTLRLYHRLGVRYSTLTHNCHNRFADAAVVTDADGRTVASTPHWGGLSQDGRDVVREMNRLGMIVDLAHVSQNTMLDVLNGDPENHWNGSLAPIIFSHSSAYSVCPHPRNVPDNILHLVKKTNSLVMVNIAPDFISCVPSPDSTSGIPDFYPPNSTIQQVVRHITHIGALIGYDHVGIGTDFDGILSTPKGLEDVSEFPMLVAEMLRAGISDSDAAKVVGANLLRVWSDVDDIAIKLQQIMQPVEDRLEPIKFI